MDQIDKAGDVITLPSGSKKLKVQLGDKQASDATKQLSHQEVIGMQNNINLSDNKRKTMLMDYRAKHGRNSVQPYIREAISAMRSDMSDFFEVQSVSAYHKNKGKEGTIVRVPRTYVFVKEVDSFLHYVIESRGLDIDNWCCILGLDDGGGSIKVCYK